MSFLTIPVPFYGQQWMIFIKVILNQKCDWHCFKDRNCRGKKKQRKLRDIFCNFRIKKLRTLNVTRSHFLKMFRILTLSVRRVAVSGTGGCSGRSLLPCTHMGRACKKQRWFEENWMSFLKMLVLNLNSPHLLRYNRLKLLLLFFLNASFLKYSGTEWVKCCEESFSKKVVCIKCRDESF